MITIDFNSFWYEQEDLKNSCITFIIDTIGEPNEIRIIKEDESDPQSSYSVQMDYEDFDIEYFNYYDEIKDFARNNELYVVVYDDFSDYRKGYWYDESPDWVEQNL